MPSVTVTTTPQKILAAKHFPNERKSYILQNQGNANIFLSFSGNENVSVVSGLNKGFRLSPNGHRVEDGKSANFHEIWAVTESGTSEIFYEEVA